jgi:hypothetical protein
MERELWKHLGLTREAILTRPAREIEDYLLYIQMIAREEQEQQRRQNRGS